MLVIDPQRAAIPSEIATASAHHTHLETGSANSKSLLLHCPGEITLGQLIVGFQSKCLQVRLNCQIPQVQGRVSSTDIVECLR
jgi:hypothetical protein